MSTPFRREFVPNNMEEEENPDIHGKNHLSCSNHEIARAKFSRRLSLGATETTLTRSTSVRSVLSSTEHGASKSSSRRGSISSGGRRTLRRSSILGSTRRFAENMPALNDYSTSEQDDSASSFAGEELIPCPVESKGRSPDGAEDVEGSPIDSYKDKIKTTGHGPSIYQGQRTTRIPRRRSMATRF